MNVLGPLGLVREGRMFRLARPRFTGMPIFPGHPRFSVLSYRTPHGLRVAREETWARATRSLLLIERGIHILESLDLEELAAAGIHEFLFVALPLKIAGATGSMVDPVAVV